MSQEQVFYVLHEDREAAVQRIAELEQEIQNLGPEFHIALNQSTETWHDNAPFDALRDTQALLVAEMQQLKSIIAKARISLPKRVKNKVSIGSRVELELENKKKAVYLIAGHWTSRVGQKIQDAFVVSCSSPLGQALLNKQPGDRVVFGPRQINASIRDIL